jgi:PAS domain S-box-containing protein
MICLSIGVQQNSITRPTLKKGGWMSVKQKNFPFRDVRMERLIQTKNWSSTPLGPMPNWPSSLSNTVHLILEIDFPIVICWGNELISIYNDAYRPLLGNKPEALGRPFLEVWSEANEIIEPQIKRVLNGKPGFYSSAEFSLTRNDNPEKAWFDYTFSPIRDDEGNIRGIINICIEVTSRINAQQKLKELNRTLEIKVKERTSRLEEYRNQLQLLTYQLNRTKIKERHEIAAFLHDHVGQLHAMSFMKLDQIQMNISDDDISEKIEFVKELLLTADKQTREFIYELKPPMIYENENIVELLHWLAQRMKKYDLEITVEDDGQPKPVSEETHKVLYESVRELCFNIIKHANTEAGTIKILRENEHVHIIVEDMGKGFNTRKVRTAKSINEGFGLFNVREQMQMLGGSLKVESQPGNGTKAFLSVPLKSHSKPD